MSSKLAILGGERTISENDVDNKLFHWPIVNQAMRDAQAKVLEDGNMSGTDISRKFEQEFAKWQGTKYALSHNNGTNALNAAMYAVGLGPGDEIICTSVTYWASCTGALALGASVVFCDIDPETLQMDPKSLEEHITPRTKAIMVVHYMAYPAPMDEIMAIAKKHNLKVIEDVSHAQGGHYKGKMLGTFGDVAGMSLMSCKSFAIGEGGMLVTDDPEIYKRAIILGHYDRIIDVCSDEEMEGPKNIPWGGLKNRMHQTASAIGIEQLKKHDAEIAEIDKALKYFWKGIEDIPGVKCIYPTQEGSDKAGWYASRFLYDKEAFGGISNVTFCDALNAETGGQFSFGCNMPLHFSSVFFDVATYGHAAHTDARALTGKLPVAESINSRVLGEPWFKKYEPAKIDMYIEAFRKVAKYAASDLQGINDTTPIIGGVALSKRKK
jgi:dTDP-4-amino-4,6-dideoxygalactose transaminase